MYICINKLDMTDINISDFFENPNFNTDYYFDLMAMLSDFENQTDSISETVISDLPF